MTFCNNHSLSPTKGFSKTVLLQIKLLLFYKFLMCINLQIFCIWKTHYFFNVSSLQNYEAVKFYCLQQQQQIIEKLHIDPLNMCQTQQSELTKKQHDGHSPIMIDGYSVRCINGIYPGNLRRVIDSLRSTTFFFPDDSFY